MFGFFKNKQPGTSFTGHFSSDQKEFLLDADEAYCLAFKKMDMSEFAKYVTRDLYMNIYRTLTYDRPWAHISDQFKTVKWIYVGDGPNGSFTVNKQVTFDKVKINKHLKLGVADDYTEIWQIIRGEATYSVSLIQEVRR